MRVTAVCLAVVASVSLAAQEGQSVPAPQPPSSAAAAIDAAIASVGGEARLTSLRGIEVDTIGHEFALEQSERPEGPWMTHYVQRREVRDAANRRLRRDRQMRDWNFPAWSPDPPLSLVMNREIAAQTNGQRWRAGTASDLDDAADALDLSPERLLLTARDARDLTLGSAETLQGIAHHSVTFTWRKRPITLFLNAWTHRPTMLRMVRDDRFGIWGDVTEQRWYSWWDLQDGLWYPRQITVEWNGRPFSDTSAMAVTIDPPLKDADFEIPAEVMTAFHAAAARPSGLAGLALDASKAIPLTPDVVLLTGAWNVLLVRQPDGIVVFEAPISSAYSAAVIAAAETQFPGASVKAVVTTSDAWPHIGGIREYVARKIPIYALDLNLPILERLVRSTRTNDPDALALRPVAPQWRPVSRPTAIGTGELAVDLIPVRGEAGERMIIASLPGVKLAYSSDLIQPGRTGGFFMPGMLAEVTTALARARAAEPSRVVGMHLAPTDWSEVTAALRAVSARQD